MHGHRPQDSWLHERIGDTVPDYELLAAQILSLAEEDHHWSCVLSNASALVYAALNESVPDCRAPGTCDPAVPTVNWAGFYLMRSGRLVLGPFQGKAACVHIDLGRGVCGTAAATDGTQLVKDVHRFPGHIACDSTSNSEIAVPLHACDSVVGILDIDSPLLSHFTETDARGLEAVARTIEDVTDFSDIV